MSSDIQQQTYVADPIDSTPLTGTPLSLATRSFPALGQTGSFTISFTHEAIDKDHVVIIRRSVQSSGNRTFAIYCGQLARTGRGSAR